MNAYGAVDDETGALVREAHRILSGRELPAGDWPEALHAELSKNELVFQLSEALAHPRPLHELPPALELSIGRPVTEEEILCWLTLGAAARNEGRPLIRPVVHGFVRGISGAVVSFPQAEPGPLLWLTAEDEIEAGGGGAQHAHFPVMTCTTCGQHYFVSYLKDFEFSGKIPGGGEAAGDTSFWQPLEEAQAAAGSCCWIVLSVGATTKISKTMSEQLQCTSAADAEPPESFGQVLLLHSPR
jgi:hypothetical protein